MKIEYILMYIMFLLNIVRFNLHLMMIFDENQNTKIHDAGASTIYIENLILIMENSDLGGCETLETPYMFLNPSILSLITILIWSCFILERFILQVKIVVALFN